MDNFEFNKKHWLLFSQVLSSLVAKNKISLDLWENSMSYGQHSYNIPQRFHLDLAFSPVPSKIFGPSEPTNNQSISFRAPFFEANSAFDKNSLLATIYQEVQDIGKNTAFLASNIFSKYEESCAATQRISLLFELLFNSGPAALGHYSTLCQCFLDHYLFVRNGLDICILLKYDCRNNQINLQECKLTQTLEVSNNEKRNHEWWQFTQNLLGADNSVAILQHFGDGHVCTKHRGPADSNFRNWRSPEVSQLSEDVANILDILHSP